METTSGSQLDSHALEVVPEERRQAVLDAFSKAPERYIQLIQDYGNQVSIEWSRILIVDGKMTSEASHYTPEQNCIYMNELKDNEEYADTFRHEFGHFLDHQLGDLSSTEEFRSAIAEDRKLYDPGGEEWSQSVTEMMADLMDNGAVDSYYISDIFSGMYLNDTKIRRIYTQTTGLAFSGHSNEYWLQIKETAPEHAVEKETFANLFGIYTENQADTIAYVKKWFPNTTACFEKML